MSLENSQRLTQNPWVPALSTYPEHLEEARSAIPSTYVWVFSILVKYKTRKETD